MKTLIIGILMAVVNLDAAVDADAKDIFISVEANTKKEIRRQISVFEANLLKEGNAMLTAIQQFVNERSNLTKARNIELLESQLKNELGLFSTFEKKAFQQSRFLSYNIQQEIYTNDIEEELGFDQNTLYTWQAIFVKTCPSCIELHGTTKKKSAWDSEGGPKVQPTICNGNCRCILMPTEVMPTRIENRKPILVESDRIRRTEKKRGKVYSPSYRSQIIGNLNNESFRKSLRDIRKIKKIT